MTTFTPSTYATDFPDVITIREGQTISIPLQFIGLTNHRFSYEYNVSAVGGTASRADLQSASGSGSISIVSTSPTSESESIPVSAGQDDVVEKTETAFLTVRLFGDMTFADGGSLRVVRIDILDDNLIVGGVGSDVLRGTTAAETLSGGLGNDRYVISVGDRVAELRDEGMDTVFSTFSYRMTNNVENLVLTGGDHSDGIGNALNNRMIGNAGNNLLNGARGADRLEGRRGNDIYIVDDAGDRIIEAANGGTDTVRASISYGLGTNVENLVLTGRGHLNGTGNALSNRLVGNDGDNRLDGAQGADTLGGGARNDTLIGREGIDRLFGGSGNDRLFGGVGEDWLVGGAGKDLLSGGLDGDRFVFSSFSDSISKAAGRDVITDFNRGQGDRIHLSSIDANQSVFGNQAFKFVGATGFSGDAGELRYLQNDGSTFIFGDIDGDRRADISIELTRQIALLEQDFIL